MESNCGGNILVLPDHMWEVRLWRFSLIGNSGAQLNGEPSKARAFASKSTGVLLCRLHNTNSWGREAREDEMKGGAGGEARGGLEIRSGRAPFEKLINPKHLGCEDHRRYAGG